MKTRVYILFLFLVAITGVILLEIIAGHSYEVLTEKVNEAHQNRIVIEQIEHIQQALPLLMIVADLIIGSGETYLQDDAQQEIVTLKQQLDSVAGYSLIKSRLPLLDEIKMRLDTISTQIRQAGELNELANMEKLSDLLNKFDNTSLELIQHLKSLHDNALTLIHYYDNQLLAEKEKQKITIYSVMALILLTFYMFTTLALRNIDSPIRMMTEAANRSLIHGKPFIANVTGSVEIKRLSKVMNSFIEQLESAVSNKTLALNKLELAHQKLIDTQLQLIQAEKLDTIGTLAAGVAHEVKNPLAIIQFGIDYIAHDRNIMKNEELMSVTEDIVNAVNRADLVIKSLLDFTSTTQEKFDITDINPVVTESVSLLKHELFKKNIELIIDLDNNLPPVEIDQNKIQQVLVNLIMNSIHAMDENGMLTIKTYTKSVKEISERNKLSLTDQHLIGDNAVVVETEDSGTGIPNDIIDDIFDPFFTTKWNGDGSGLGLTIVHNIVHLHDAIIKIKNRENRGVKATLIFRAAIV